MSVSFIAFALKITRKFISMFVIVWGTALPCIDASRKYVTEYESRTPKEMEKESEQRREKKGKDDKQSMRNCRAGEKRRIPLLGCFGH